ncbi:MAG: hypothetical protein ACXIVE_12895 [Salinarimonas sp.]
MGQDEGIAIGECAEGAHARPGIDAAQLPDLIALRIEALQESVLVPSVTDRDEISRYEPIEISEEGTGPIAGMLVKHCCINLLPQFRRQQNDPHMRDTRIRRAVNMQTPVIQTGSNMLLY